jgi:hypothetical protein
MDRMCRKMCRYMARSESRRKRTMPIMSCWVGFPSHFFFFFFVLVGHTLWEGQLRDILREILAG